jgi:undecaprenyl-diphosphatase
MSMRKTTRVVTTIGLAILLGAVTASAAETGTAPFTLSWRLDAPLLATGVPMFAVSLLLPTVVYDGAPLDPHGIPAVDAWCLCGYCSWSDRGSDHAWYALLALPVLYGLLEGPPWMVPLGVMFTEAFALSMGIDGLLEKAVRRPRPYLYTGTASPEILAMDEGLESFPSGHTTSSCAAASFIAYTYCRLHPDSPWRLPVCAGVTVLAGVQAAFRLRSGEHFLTDIVAGALLGTAAGVLVPIAHEHDLGIRPRADGVEVTIPLR